LHIDFAKWAQTWTAQWLFLHYMSGIASVGIAKDPSAGFGHSRTAYMARAATKPLFVELHSEQKEDLQTSFDTVSVFPNWALKDLKTSKTKGLWLHVDQDTSDHSCYQGMVSLKDTTAQTGGLVVAPGSHLRHKEIRATIDRKGNYLPLNQDDPAVSALIEGGDLPGLRMVTAPKGSLFLWDSRTVHSNHYALQTPTTKDSVLRLNVHVCFLPRRTNQETNKMREEAVNDQKLANHWTYVIEGCKNGPMKFERLAYPRHKSFKPLQSCAMSAEAIRSEFADIL
jgi:hypothetical protein